MESTNYYWKYLPTTGFPRSILGYHVNHHDDQVRYHDDQVHYHDDQVHYHVTDKLPKKDTERVGRIGGLMSEYGASSGANEVEWEMI